jgi:hypothetical protein
VFERDEMNSVAGSLLPLMASINAVCTRIV